MIKARHRLRFSWIFLVPVSRTRLPSVTGVTLDTDYDEEMTAGTKDLQQRSLDLVVVIYLLLRGIDTVMS